MRKSQRWMVTGVTSICSMALTAVICYGVVTVASDAAANTRASNQYNDWWNQGYDNQSDFQPITTYTNSNLVFGCLPSKGKYLLKYVGVTTDSKWVTLGTYKSLRPCMAEESTDISLYNDLNPLGEGQ